MIENKNQFLKVVLVKKVTDNKGLRKKGPSEKSIHKTKFKK